MLFSVGALSSLLAVARHVSAATATAPAHFLMISGVTAADETCLAGSAAGVWLESCEKAVAGMSGEEIWSLATDGSLVHAGSKTCLSPKGTTSAAGAPLALVSCDAAGGVAKWELQGNGQVKMAQSNMCISQVGPSGAVVNAAASASVSASSTLDPSHGAALAVDGVASTYWVSKMDEADAVSLLLDFGEPVHGSVLELDFEFVPSVFSVQAAEASSENWLQIFATDSNALKHVKIPARVGQAHVGNQTHHEGSPPDSRDNGRPQARWGPFCQAADAAAAAGAGAMCSRGEKPRCKRQVFHRCSQWLRPASWCCFGSRDACAGVGRCGALVYHCGAREGLACNQLLQACQPYLPSCQCHDPERSATPCSRRHGVGRGPGSSLAGGSQGHHCRSAWAAGFVVILTTTDSERVGVGVKQQNSSALPTELRCNVL